MIYKTLHFILCMALMTYTARAGGLYKVGSECATVGKFELHDPDKPDAALIAHIGSSTLSLGLKPLIDKDNLALSSFVLQTDVSVNGSCGSLNYTWGPEEDESKNYPIRVATVSHSIRLSVTDQGGAVLAFIEMPVSTTISNTVTDKNIPELTIVAETLYIHTDNRRMAADLAALAHGHWRIVPGMSYKNFARVIQWYCIVDSKKGIDCGCRRSNNGVHNDDPDCTDGAERTVNCGISVDPALSLIRVIPFETNFMEQDLPFIGNLRKNSVFQLTLYPGK